MWCLPLPESAVGSHQTSSVANDEKEAYPVKGYASFFGFNFDNSFISLYD
jgi:hypothetical protein